MQIEHEIDCGDIAYYTHILFCSLYKHITSGEELKLFKLSRKLS